MFLVNSRAVLVTAIYHCFLLQKKQKTTIDTPYTEDTGLICRIPLTSLAFYVLAFSARTPVLVLGTAN